MITRDLRQKMDPKLLSDYKKSLKECSESDSGEPVTLSELPAYRFDEISAFEAERISYFLIYNDKAVQKPEKPSEYFRELKRKLKGFAEKTDTYPVLGNMEAYQNTFYRRVYTIDVLDFEQEFLGKIYGS